jgi:HK97 family phage major capsid protein
MWISQGASVDQVSEDILKILEERGKANPQPVSKVGLTESETKQFSMMRAILACANNDWSKAGFEADCSRAVGQAFHKAPDPKKFYVPFEVLERKHDVQAMEQLRSQLGLGRRDLTVASVGAGGYLVSTDNMGFIEILRNRSVAFTMGARRLSGLTGNVTVPKHTGAGTGYWLANEGASTTESNQAFLQMALTPKTVAAYTEISRLLLLQSSPSAEGIVTDDLANVIALAADLAALAGSGGSQPQGIIGTSGVGSVTGTNLAYTGILEFQSDVASSNVRPAAGGYVTTPLVASKLMARSRFTNTDTPLWVGNLWDGQMAGFRAMSSMQIPTDDMLFGDWQELVIGEWGVLEVEVNPYANFQAGIIGVRAMYSMDVGVRRAYAFSLATSIT